MIETLEVIELVIEHLAYGWSPEELRFQHPYLTLGQIHAALAYYWDNTSLFDQEIAGQLRRVEELRTRVTREGSPLSVRLKS